MIFLYSDFKPSISDLVDKAVLKSLADSPCKIGYIPSDSDIKRRYFAKVEDQYKKIGIFDVTYFDLGVEFDQSQMSNLLSCNAIHLSGGDPLRFMEFMVQRQFRTVLKTYLAGGGTIIGVSAGAMILGPTLGLIEFETRGLISKKATKGLKLIDFEFYPHFKGDEKSAQKLLKYARQRGCVVYACDDDAGLGIDNQNNIELIGSVEIFKP